MNQCSYNLMETLVKKYVNNPQKVLDVGSYDVNGCYKSIFSCPYTGLDMAQGPNVDYVATESYKWDLPDNNFDLVISGQCFEHVQAPWLLIKEMERVCSKWMIIVAPWKWRIHRYPVDCWRILPDGMEFLLNGWCQFEVKECNTACEGGPLEGLCYGVGLKK
jgi:SAM-dependent methyltransferase